MIGYKGPYTYYNIGFANTALIYHTKLYSLFESNFPLEIKAYDNSTIKTIGF